MPKSLRLNPAMPPAQRASFDYLGLLDAVRLNWPRHTAASMVDLWVNSPTLRTRIAHEVGRLLRHVAAAGERLLSEDLPQIASELGADLPLLAADGPLSRSIQSWLRNAEVEGSKMRDLPPVVPPLAMWGHAPDRFDAAPGVSPFGLWTDREEPSAFPWWDSQFTAAVDGSGGGPQATEAAGYLIASATNLCWRSRLGHGPESWNEFLADCSREPVWIAWALHRLVTSWTTAPNDPRDRAFVDAHLLQAAWGYREWLRKHFGSSKARKIGDEVREEMYDLQGFAYVDPRSLIPDDLPRLHRLAAFVVYCCERLADAGVAPRTFKPRVHAAWLSPFANYLKTNPDTSLDDMCAAIGVNRSTVMRSEAAMKLYHEKHRARARGFRKSDGSIEGFTDPDDEELHLSENS
ncbi:MAG TPA: hypothetical protein PLJ47_17075 [Candidatus Hydrogenedentes bacterium]|nr:hypothetical protein [Candidatus Hydrogenedentota bacterium]